MPLFGRSLPIGTICISVVAASPAVAAQTVSEADGLRHNTHRYLECAIDRDMSAHGGHSLTRFLGAPFETKKSRKSARKLLRESCLYSVSDAREYAVQSEFSSPVLRGQAYRALYLQGWGRDRATHMRATLGASLQVPASEPYSKVKMFGDCVVSLDSAASEQLIRAEAGNAAERSAYQQLWPAFAQCLTPNTTVKFDKLMLEGAIAEALYGRFLGSAAGGQN